MNSTGDATGGGENIQECLDSLEFGGTERKNMGNGGGGSSRREIPVFYQVKASSTTAAGIYWAGIRSDRSSSVGKAVAPAVAAVISGH